MVAFAQLILQLPDIPLHRAVVAGIARRIVQRDDHMAPQDRFHGLGIEGRAIVAFKEERRSVAGKELVEMSGDLLGLFAAA